MENSKESFSMHEILQCIPTLAKAVKELQEDSLPERTLVLLLHDYTKVNKRDIIRVLRALPELKEAYFSS